MSSLPSVTRVAQAFSQAAQDYDKVAGLQRQVADHLLQHCGPQLHGQVMDLGCGTGYITRQLAQQQQVSSVLGVDIAPGMIEWCRQHIDNPRCAWLVADAQALPVTDHSINYVVSSLAMQWCADQRALFDNSSRVLKPGGCFYATTLGPQTLHELRWAWQQVDAYQHVNEFVSQGEILTAMHACFAQVQVQEHTITLWFDKVSDILRELKQLGASNHNLGARHGLTTRRHLQRMTDAYETRRNQLGKLPVSYQVYTITATSKVG
ncbi:MAG: malonyl-ACP O-methyltransferase BioC [Gammaproteobacteria bacterium]|jgi:malonyl-CoA O-methyltransferase|nr:malonyl-ACP O-methyltransferase BioC [Gammaproteobacteria bacterium]